MESLALRYYELSNPDEKANHLRVELYYLKDGVDMWTGRPRARGYYLSAYPVLREDCGSYAVDRMEPFGAGGYTLLSTVQRKSGAAAAHAKAAAGRMLPEVAATVLRRAGRSLSEEAARRLAADVEALSG